MTPRCHQFRNRKGILRAPRNLDEIVRPDFRREMWMTPLQRRRYFCELNDPLRFSATGGLTTQWLRLRRIVCIRKPFKTIDRTQHEND